MLVDTVGSIDPGFAEVKQRVSVFNFPSRKADYDEARVSQPLGCGYYKKTDNTKSSLSTFLYRGKTGAFPKHSVGVN